MAKVIVKVGEPSVMFYCEGCKGYHGVWVEEANELGQRWWWNGSVDKPSFSPSINIVYRKDHEHRSIVMGRCHSFIVDGRIKYLPDSSHELREMEVELTEVDSVGNSERKG